MKCDLPSSKSPTDSSHFTGRGPCFLDSSKSLSFAQTGLPPFRAVGELSSSRSLVITQNQAFFALFTGFRFCQLCSPFTSYLCCHDGTIQPPLFTPFLYDSEGSPLCSRSSNRDIANRPLIPYPTCIRSPIGQLPTKHHYQTDQMRRSRLTLVASHERGHTQLPSERGHVCF